MLCKKLTIFEGCDGSGKSTAAKEYAIRTGACYVHMGPVENVADSYYRINVDAMLPALLGYQDVVLDRSWLSEVPYGVVCRAGRNRLDLGITAGDHDAFVLERMALRCGAVVVYCDPGLEAIEKVWHRREEMLKKIEDLRAVHHEYGNMVTSLPVTNYNWQSDSKLAMLDDYRAPLHAVYSKTAGNLSAGNIVVVDCTRQIQYDDSPSIQFGTADRTSPRQKDVAAALLRKGVQLGDTLWLSQDSDLEYFCVPAAWRPALKVFSSGPASTQALYSAGITAEIL